MIWTTTYQTNGNQTHQKLSANSTHDSGIKKYETIYEIFVKKTETKRSYLRNNEEQEKTYQISCDVSKLNDTRQSYRTYVPLIDPKSGENNQNTTNMKRTYLRFIDTNTRKVNNKVQK